MLVGLAGPAGVGKTTIANLLVKYMGFERLAYADPLKWSLVSLTGLPIQHFTDPKLKESAIPELGKSPRQLMQLFGTEFVRGMVYDDFWVWRMSERLPYKMDYKNVVIDDCRFENETALVRERGGQVIHLERNFESPTIHTSHESEQSLKVHEDDLIISSGDHDESFTFRFILEIVSRP